MHLEQIKEMLHGAAGAQLDVYERRPGQFQVIIPILHEDGDMVDIYMHESPAGKNMVRVCDFGMTLMRLSYTYEISSESRQRIFDGILINSGVNNDNGNLYIDSSADTLYECILQFAGCVQKVCNMRYWSKENVRSTFYDALEEYTLGNLQQFNPRPHVSPLPDYQIISVDWVLTHNRRDIFLFGVKGNEKAKSVAISLLEFQKKDLNFISIVAHEDMENLGKKEKLYITKNADNQYPNFSDFQEKIISDVERMVA